MGQLANFLAGGTVQVETVGDNPPAISELKAAAGEADPESERNGGPDGYKGPQGPAGGPPKCRL